MTDESSTRNKVRELVENPAKVAKPKAATQSTIGAEFIRRNQGMMYTRGDFYRYGNGVWERQAEMKVRRDGWGILKLYEQASQCRPTANMLRGILHYIEDHMFVAEDEVDARPELINLLNGTYDLETQTLLPHDPLHYLTTQLPFAFDADATCPTWDYFLSTSLTKALPHEREADPELAGFLQEAVGYSLTTDISHHLSFWCYGRGANGKGVLFHVLEELAGTCATPFNVNLLKRDRYQLADLAGKRIALCSEANSHDNIVEDGDVKALIAGDKMNVRQIRERTFVLEPQVKLWWSMNRLPAIADTSEGFWRRIKVLPFNRVFAEDERLLDLTDRLQQELPGIFNWAMVGLKRLRMQGFSKPAQIDKHTADYQHESNIVTQFIEDDCIIDDDAKVQSSAIYDAFRYWCKRNGYSPYSSRSFKREMESLGYFSRRHAAGAFFFGITLPVTPLSL